MPFAVHKAYQIRISKFPNGAIIDLLSVSTPRMIRLIDCKRLIEADMLTIYETPRLPPKRFGYAAAVYPQVTLGPESTALMLFKARSSSPIRIDVDTLKRICLEAENNETDYIWVDQLCIHSGDCSSLGEAANRMYRIFELSRVFMAFPTGIETMSMRFDHIPWMSGIEGLAEALLSSRVRIYVHSDSRFIGLTDWLHIHTSRTGFNTGGYSLMDAHYFNKKCSTDDNKYYRSLSLWKCALRRQSQDADHLLSTTIYLLYPSEKTLQEQISHFLRGVSDPFSSDPVVLAFRDAFDHVGARCDLSAQWGDIVTSLRPPSVYGPARDTGGICFVRLSDT